MRTMVFVHNLRENHVEAIQKAAPGWRVVHGRDAEVWQPVLREAEIVGGWNSQVETTFLESPAWSLKWLQNWGAGVDNLPLAAIRERGVMVTNASGVHANPISETVLALMLALTRKIDAYVRNQSTHTWHNSGLKLEMHGKTVGILGVGAIGEEVARLCKAFGMRVQGVRRSGLPVDAVDEMMDMGGLHRLLEHSDYVVNTLPLTTQTKGLIGREEFALMKPSSFYINIGRGGTTDEFAMVDALRENRIAGAGLDVFAVEPLPADSPLWDLSNVIVTPHTSGATEHYDDRVIDIFLRNFESYIEGKELAHNRINLDLEY